MSLRLNASVLSWVATLCLAAPLALAAPSLGHDEITLKNGGSIRCTVVSVEPGTKVVILELGSEEPRTLTWAEVADVLKDKYPDEAEPTRKVEPGDAGPGYDGPNHTKEKHRASSDDQNDHDDSNRGVVKVHISSPKPVRLVEELGTATAVSGNYVVAVQALRTACMSPCDKTIDGSRGQRFYVEGDGVTSAGGFSLADREKDVDVNVDPGSKPLRVGGVFVTITGASAMVVGALLIPLGYTLTSTFRDIHGHDVEIENTGLKVAGGITLGIGAATLAGGIAMIVKSKTSIELSDVKGSKTALASKKARAPRYWAGEF